MAQRMCLIEGCEKPVKARGRCDTHVAQWYRSGGLLLPGSALPTPAERFWTKVDQSAGPDGCWLWTACTDQGGYGRFGLNGGLVGAHRFSFVMAQGPIPFGLEIDHTCHDPDQCKDGPKCPHRRCVNPAHLALATPGENTRRSNAGRMLVNRENVGKYNRIKTHCPQNHPYSGDNLFTFHDGRRACRTCMREAQRRYKQRRRAQHQGC